MFRRMRDMVQDRSPEEENQYLVTQLPDFWHRLVTREQAKQRKQRPWVRITFSEPRRGPAILNEIETDLGYRLPRQRPCVSGYILECPTEEDREALLRYNGWTSGEVRISVSRFEYEMSGDALIDFITERLRSDAECTASREALGLPISTPSVPTTKVVVKESAPLKKR